MKIINRQFIHYKLFNSIFLGLTVGSIFTIYAPLEPSVYSIGGILLALAMLFIAKLYYKILNINYFYKISLFVELVMLLVIMFFLLSKHSYTTSLLIYIGYQLTFSFGSYLVRAETILLKKSQILTFVDVAKQKGYLLGMFISFIYYKGLEYFYDISSNYEKVYSLHFILVFLELLIIYLLIKSFNKKKL